VIIHSILIDEKTVHQKNHDKDSSEELVNIS